MKSTSQTVARLTALIVSTALPTIAFAESAADPNDPQTWRTPEFQAQWGLAAIYAEYAYMLGLDGSGVKVGVVDSGLSIDHPEFSGRYVEGITFDPERPWTFAAEGHGTTVASVIAANRDGVGMHGVAPGATIVQAGAGEEPGYINPAAALYGIRTLVDRGVRIINNSYGTGFITDFSAKELELSEANSLETYRYAVSRGGLLVFSAMNDGATQPAMEAGLPYLFPELEQGWLAVVATGPSYMPNWSNECGVAMNWCLTAPGGTGDARWDADKGEWVWVNDADNIMVAVPGGGYDRATGTSLAAPFVAGTAALVAQAFPYMTMDQIRQVLLGTARDFGAPGVDPVFGYGLVSVGKAVRGPAKFDWGDFHATISDGRSLWSNDITGAGGLIKSGDGVLVLTGDSRYQGDTRVDGGVLAIGGSIASDTFIDQNGTLSGNGIVHADVENAGAIYALWGGKGDTLIIDGNFRQSQDAWLLVDLDAPDSSSRLDITGTAAIAGAVDVFVAPGSYRGDSSQVILSALGGVTGRFEDDCGCHAFLDLTLSYDPNTVYLDVARNDIAFADVATTGNSRAAASAVERLGIGRPLYGLAVTLNDVTAADLFAQLPGEIYASAVTGLTENSRLIGNQINDRLRSAFETAGAKASPIANADEITTASISAGDYGAWGAAFGSWGRTDGDGNAAELSRSTGGFVAGVDGPVNNDWRLGFLAGYSHSSFKVDDRRSSASSDNYHLGVYGGAQWDALSFRSGLSYTWSDIDASRRIASLGLIDSMSGEYRAGTTEMFGEIGYGLRAGDIAIEPFANLAHVNVDTNGFSENGGAAALDVGSDANDTTFTTLGLRAATNFDIGPARTTARGMVGWRHAYGDVIPTITQAFAGGDTLTVAGAPIAKDSIAVEAGLDLAITPAVVLDLSYQGQIASTGQSHGLRANLNVRF